MNLLAARIAGLLVLMPLVSVANPGVSPGLWEITTKVNIPQLPFGLTIPRNAPLPQSGSRQVCVTDRDIQDPANIVKTQSGCDLGKFEEVNGQITWTATCQGPPRSTTSGKLQLANESLTGKALVNTDIQGFSVPISLSYFGRRLGECS